LRVLLGEEPQLAPVKRFLAERTEGNPFFVEEIVRTLLEARILAGARGQYRLAQPFSSVQIPATVHAVLAARIDRLEPDQKRLLQEAAVIGKDVPFALLQAVSDLPEQELRARLAELQSAEYLYEGRLFPELEYTFKHSLTREVAYSNLLRERTRSLHAQVAQALIKLAAGRLEEHVEQIAEHAEQGYLWSTAIEYLQRSGEKAFALYANDEAEKYFRRALAALRNVPQDRAMLELAADLRFALRNALIALCKLRDIEECLRDAGPVVAQLGDKRRSARHASFMCNHHFLAADPRRVLEAGEAGLRLARESGDRRIEGELLFRIALARHVLGENREAIRLVGEGIDCTVDQRQAERFGLAFTPAVGYRIWLVVMLAECGDFRAGMAHARRAVEISTEAQHPLSEVLGWLAVGHLSLRKGDLDEAIEALERGVGLSDRYSLPLWRLRLETSLGVAHAYCGRLAEGIEMTSRALAGAESIGLMVDQPLLHVHLGEALLLAGRMDEAIAHAKRALELALAQENRRDEPWARLLIARALRASERGTIGQAGKELEAALSLAVAGEARPLEAHCRALLASIHEAAGDQSEAAELAAAAAALHSALGMRPLPLEPSRGSAESYLIPSSAR
jgi:tetratricopeptide (TPR) repeat protein